MFEGNSASAEETLTKAIVSAREWINSQEKQRKPPAIKNQPRLRIAENCTVVTTDASWRATTKAAGLGWTIKSQQRMSEFTSYVQCVGSALAAEGLAMREAIAKCREMEIQRLHCHSDLASLIKAITSGEAPPELYGIMSDITFLCRSLDVFSCSWISRVQNNAADKLAKMCLVEGEAFMADT